MCKSGMTGILKTEKTEILQMNYRYLVNFRATELDHTETEIIVVGGGIAGLFAALTLATSGYRVILLTKGRDFDSNTYHAQGGIAAALDDFDSPELHFQDTISAGAGLCDPEAVRVMVEEGPEMIRELIALGVKFDQDEGRLALTREGAHSRSRIVHADGDATGREIIEVLECQVRRQGNISWVEDTFVIDVLTIEGRACGVLALQPGGSLIIYYGCAVILATGGLGRLFEYTTNPEGATGDGMAMAFRAGADLIDMEFIQFHPTVLDLQGAPRFLISEAVRGEGAVLLDSHGERFVHRYHPLGELAPRDVVVRAMVTEMRKMGGLEFFLDMRPLGEHLIKERFPHIYHTCLEYGLDITREPIPVSPAAHYCMGGIHTDLWGHTRVPGLFACGEAACTGAHGANRLASNSLLEGVVFGRRAALKAAEYVEKTASCKPFADTSALMNFVDRIYCSLYDSLSPDPLRRANLMAKVMDDLRNLRGDACNEMISSVLDSFEGCKPDVEFFVDLLRRAMTRGAGIARSGEGLSALQRFLKALAPLHHLEFRDTSGLELQNMMTLADIIVRAALARTESRGAHFREDFPLPDDGKWLKHLKWNIEDTAIKVDLHSAAAAPSE